MKGLKVEITPGVVVADAFDHGADARHLGGGQASAVHVGADHVAEDPAEILVARVADETARIGQHADEAAEQAERGEDVQLATDAALLVQEPPGGAELHLAGHGAVVEVAGHRGHDLEVLGIQAVKDCFRQFAFGVQPVEEAVALSDAVDKTVDYALDKAGIDVPSVGGLVDNAVEAGLDYVGDAAGNALKNTNFKSVNDNAGLNAGNQSDDHGY